MAKDKVKTVVSHHHDNTLFSSFIPAMQQLVIWRGRQVNKPPSSPCLFLFVKSYLERKWLSKILFSKCVFNAYYLSQLSQILAENQIFIYMPKHPTKIQISLPPLSFDHGPCRVGCLWGRRLCIWNKNSVFYFPCLKPIYFLGQINSQHLYLKETLMVCIMTVLLIILNKKIHQQKKKKDVCKV